MDRLSPAKRSWNMGRIKNKNTEPEVIVRRLLHNQGFRFRLHTKNLPGSPDIVLPKYKTVIFVHGCFWHRHSHCADATTPKTRTDFWESKFLENINRDKKNHAALLATGWKVLIVWSCEVRNTSQLLMRLTEEILG